MKLIKGNLWPRPARVVANAHNHKWHDKREVAFISAQKDVQCEWIPYYDVYCPDCIDWRIADEGLEMLWERGGLRCRQKTSGVQSVKKNL